MWAQQSCQICLPSCRAYKSSGGDLDMLYGKNVRKFLGHRRKVNKN